MLKPEAVQGKEGDPVESQQPTTQQAWRAVLPKVCSFFIRLVVS